MAADIIGLGALGQDLLSAISVEVEDHPLSKETEEKMQMQWTEYQSLNTQPGTQRPRDYRHFKEKSEARSPVQEIGWCLSGHHFFDDPGQLIFDDSGDLIPDDSGQLTWHGKVVRLLSQKPYAQRKRRIRGLGGSRGCSNPLLVHKGNLLQVLPQMPSARTQRELYNKAYNRTVSENPTPYQYPVEKRVQEMLADINVKNMEREKERSASALPLEFPEFMSSGDIPDDI